MPSPVSKVERHPHRDEIDLAIVASQKSDQAIGNEYGLSRDSIWRRREALKKDPLRWQELHTKARENALAEMTGTTAADSMNVAAAYDALAKRVERMLDAAEADDNPALALAAANGLRRVLADIATLQGKMAKHLNITVALAEQKEWQQLRDMLDITFRNHPDARDTFLAHVRAHRELKQAPFIEVGKS